MQAEAPRLPQPDAAQIAHSERCAAAIRQHIEGSDGSISFGEFMHHALYAPGLGYYASGPLPFGARGDFVTAPEVSPLFGYVVARQCAAALAELGGGSVLEYGAGSGALACDVLQKLEVLDRLPRRYRILEPSAALVARQRERIEQQVPALADLVEWVERRPADHRGVIIANEVLDALPVERFVRRDAVMQLHVGCRDGRFEWRERHASEIVREAVDTLERQLGERLPEGYESEISLALPGWVRDLVDGLEEGLVLLFDYGVSQREYYHHDRSGGWLRCHFRHHAHSDPLILAGIQDITAWVNFTAVASAAVEAGARIAGYTQQSAFLLHGGIEAEISAMKNLSAGAQAELSAAVKMLTLPGSMGEHFKCMALTRGALTAPVALQFADRTHVL
ncbi:MAG: SAM-dependent methyltransferase [Woeseiaceae bacterium]|nr:SAM-dependent methyltransferase [Woeseiaceae bacterium]